MAKQSVKKFLESSDSEESLKKQMAASARIIERQAKQIERYRAARTRSVKAKKPLVSKGGFLRVICGDSHGAYQDDAAVAAFLGDLDMLRPAEVVHVGDALDCGGFLSAHGVLGVVPELAVTYEEDVLAANNFLDGVQKYAPGAKVTLIEGNHERRIKTQTCKMVLANHANAEFILSMCGVEKVLNIEKRGIRFIHRDRYYDDLSVSGTIKLEPHAVAQHGEAHCGKYATFRQLDRLKRSVFSGHTHRLQCVYDEGIDSHLVGVNTGCLCQLRPLYGLTKVTSWTHGYVLQFVEPKEGEFLAVPVPIVGGRSFLSPMLKVVQ